jgi:hypothetical protein
LRRRRRWKCTIVFFSDGVVEKKKAIVASTIAFFYGSVVEKKKATIVFITFFDGFVAKISNDN